MTAEYRSLRLSGKIVANIRLGSREYLSPIVVADFAVDGTIGFDLMSEYKCALIRYTSPCIKHQRRSTLVVGNCRAKGSIVFLQLIVWWYFGKQSNQLIFRFGL